MKSRYPSFPIRLFFNRAANKNLMTWGHINCFGYWYSLDIPCSYVTKSAFVMQI